MKSFLKIFIILLILSLAAVVVTGIGYMATGTPVFDKLSTMLGDPQQKRALWSAVIAALFFLLVLSASLKLLLVVLGQGKKRSEESSVEESPESGPTRVDTQEIVSHFLRLYKKQLDVEDGTPANMVPLVTDGGKSERVWELSVKNKDQWEKRRMSISRIGDENASKSTCFYAIYNVHMVIKVPPSPARDFEAYLKSIRKEWSIADLLSPRPCLVPGLTVILKQLRVLGSGKDLSPKELEDMYIFWARGQKDIQSYLKIGKGFALFMDLSTHMFLSRVLDEMHDLDSRIQEEISGYPEVLQDAQIFEGRYGAEGTPACQGLQKAYAACEEELAAVLAKEAGPDCPQVHKLGKWFMTYVAEKPLTKEETGLKPVAHKAMDMSLKKAVEKSRGAVLEYRRAINKYTTSLTFTQNRPKMAGICANLLDLLAYLGQKNVAMRDLKPDNLLVAGETGKYPQFLLEPESYCIGLIDVETAVVTVKGVSTEQPMLAGTPIYATPAHMMPNHVIRAVYGNLPLLLHLQDWHATVGMLYEVITGEQLFKKTAMQLSEVVRLMSSGARESRNPEEAVKNGSRLFWESATAEFFDRVSAKKALLQAVEVPLFESALAMFREVFPESRDSLAASIAESVASQTFYTSERNRQYLLNASSDQVGELSDKLADEYAEASEQQNVKKQAVPFLRELEAGKKMMEVFDRVVNSLGGEKPVLPASDILTAMFLRTRSVMFKKEWGSI